MSDPETTEAMRQRVRQLSAAIEVAKESRRGSAVRNHVSSRSYTPSHPYSPRGRVRGRGGYYRNVTLHVNNANEQTTDPSTDSRLASSASTQSLDAHHARPGSAIASRQHGHTVNVSPGVYNTSRNNRSTPSVYRRLGLFFVHLDTSNQARRPKTELCRTFCQTGQCRKGSSCRFIHDPSKVAICKEFLAKGICHKDPYCDLSHSPTVHRVPLCLYYARGNCTNTQCRYAHTDTDLHAPICASFANLGYCDRGADCSNRHEHECPEYSTRGSCSNPKCRLPHIDRAGQLRQRTHLEQSIASSDKSQVPGDLLDSLEDALNSDMVQDTSKGISKEERPRSSSSSGGSSSGAQASTFQAQDNFLPLELDADDASYEQRFAS